MALMLCAEKVAQCKTREAPKTAECVVQLCCYCDVDKTRNSGNSDNVNIGRKSGKGVLKPLII